MLFPIKKCKKKVVLIFKIGDRQLGKLSLLREATLQESVWNMIENKTLCLYFFSLSVSH